MDVAMLLAEGPTISLEDFAALKPEVAWSHPQDENYVVLRLGDAFLAAIFQTNVADGGEPIGKTLFESEQFDTLGLAQAFAADRFTDTLKAGTSNIDTL
ncbi:hypothetical protein [Microvirga antarctica]|uniref:hypothetical protein n=1 Tax=Microvirga antarctica TaxID=2819233 RepID=UPI001B3151BF|nr:hypothetical protein [Microvirga antarctica]